MEFTTSSHLLGPAGPALEAALATLAHHGFLIEDRQGETAKLRGPGLNSTRQNPLLGASEVRLSIRGGQLHLEAILGGADRLGKFASRFPLLLGASLGVVFAVMGIILGPMGNQGGGMAVWTFPVLALGAGLLPVLPWLFIGPWLARRIRQNTQQSLQDLVTNSVQLGRDNA